MKNIRLMKTIQVFHWQQNGTIPSKITQSALKSKQIADLYLWLDLLCIFYKKHLRSEGVLTVSLFHNVLGLILVNMVTLVLGQLQHVLVGWSVVDRELFHFSFLHLLLVRNLMGLTEKQESAFISKRRLFFTLLHIFLLEFCHQRANNTLKVLKCSLTN